MYSHRCLESLQLRYGDKLEMGRLEGANTVKLYYDQEKLDKFLGSPMAKFWAEKGYPYKTLSPDESRLILPHLKSPQESDNEGLIAGVWNDPPADSTGDSKMFCQVRFTTVNNTQHIGQILVL